MGTENNPHGLKVGRSIYIEAGYGGELVAHRITNISGPHAIFTVASKAYHVHLVTLRLFCEGLEIGSVWATKKAFRDFKAIRELRHRIKNHVIRHEFGRDLSLSQLREAAKALGIESKGTQ